MTIQIQQSVDKRLENATSAIRTYASELAARFAQELDVFAARILSEAAHDVSKAVAEEITAVVNTAENDARGKLTAQLAAVLNVVEQSPPDDKPEIAPQLVEVVTVADATPTPGVFASVASAETPVPPINETPVPPAIETPHVEPALALQTEAPVRRTKKYRCLYCRRTFDTPNALTAHTRAHRREQATRREVYSSQPKRDPKKAAPKFPTTCIKPGCCNPAKGPRWHFLCVLHRDAEQPEIEKWQKAHKVEKAKAEAK